MFEEFDFVAEFSTALGVAHTPAFFPDAHVGHTRNDVHPITDAGFHGLEMVVQRTAFFVWQEHRAAMSANSSAFPRAFFDQAFRQENQAAHLHPFRDDVADDLPPFALRLHFPKQNGPANTGHDDEDQQRMPPKKIQNPVSQMSFHAPALGGLRLQQILRADNEDDRAAPVGYRISKK